jgi:xylulokinase
MLYLGIDSGTQSTKSIVLDLETGAILAQSSQGYGLIEGLPPGHLEQHPEDWFAATKATVADCLGQIGERRRELRGIGVSGQQHGLVVLDGDGAVVRPAKLWCDTSTSEQCAQFEGAFGGKEGIIARTGNAMLPGYTIPKLLWLKQNEPDPFRRVRTVLLPHDYLNFRLTGIKRMEYGDASGTGILNVRTREWDRELTAFVDPAVDAMLPELGSSNTVHGTLLPELAAEWGLSPEVLVSAGGGDNMMGAIGTGNLGGGVVTASFGTSGTLYACSEQPLVDPQGEVAAFCDSTDRWLPLVCTMNVTVVTEQVRSWFGWDLAELERQVTSVPAGAEGVSFLPYLNGERTPNLPCGTGVLHGLGSASASPAHLARAAMEGATLGLGYGLRRFAELGLNPSEIRLTGGGSKSAVWRQIAADVFGVPVVALATAEGAGLGAAIQAAHADGQGSYEDLSRRLVALDESTGCSPSPDRVELYREKLDRQMELTFLLRDRGWL